MLTKCHRSSNTNFQFHFHLILRWVLLLATEWLWCHGFNSFTYVSLVKTLKWVRRLSFNTRENEIATAALWFLSWFCGIYANERESFTLAQMRMYSIFLIRRASLFYYRCCIFDRKNSTTFIWVHSFCIQWRSYNGKSTRQCVIHNAVNDFSFY